MDYITNESATIAACAFIIGLILIREGLQEKYMHIEKDPVKRLRLSKKWHAAGGWLRMAFAGLVWLSTECYYTTGAAAVALSLGYNITINIYKGHKWWFVGTTALTDKLIRKVLFFIDFNKAL